MSNKPIYVSQPFLPEFDKYMELVKGVFDRKQLTNGGPLVTELESRLANYLGVDYLLLVANGTLALNIAYKTLDIKGIFHTTPFSFAATASSVLWAEKEVVFVDINENTFNLDPTLLNQDVIRPTDVILPVHVFGNPCDTGSLEKISKDTGCKIIYDGSHAFGVKIAKDNLFNYGDAVTLSFHATKLFHSVEGGAIVFKKEKDYLKAKKLINFGFDLNGDITEVGINAKMSELHAAMGLAVLDNINEIIHIRKSIHERYIAYLDPKFTLQRIHDSVRRNFAYFPVLFNSEKELLCKVKELNKQNIYPRRYFYPSLSSVSSYSTQDSCSVSRIIASKILCLPLHTYLNDKDIDTVISIVNN